MTMLSECISTDIRELPRNKIPVFLLEICRGDRPVAPTMDRLFFGKFLIFRPVAVLINGFDPVSKTGFFRKNPVFYT